MKKSKKSGGRTKRVPTDETLRKEYDFDIQQAQPNRFAGRIDRERMVVVLDPDLARVFKSSAAVNHALRTLLAAVPARS